jgi:signal transduction histidine kinase
VRSFRAKLIAANVAVLLIVLVSFGVTTAILTERAVLGNIDRDLTVFLERMRGPGFGPPQGSGPGGPGMRAQNMAPRDDPRLRTDPLAPRAIDPDGLVAMGQPVLSEPGFRAAAQGARDYRTVEFDGVQVRVVSLRRQTPSGGWQVVQAGRDLTETQALLAQQRNVLLLMLPVAVIVAALGGAFLVRRSLKPVEDVTHAAEKIGAEDLSMRLEVHGDDELANLAKTFNGMIERLDLSFTDLEGAFENQRRFVADASHELRTPLSRVKLLTSASLTQQSSEAEKTEALRGIDAAADDMARLIEGLLALARADAGKIAVASDDIDIGDCAKGAVKALAADLRIRVDVVAGTKAKGDADAVQRILTNFLTNAQRYTDTHGKITVSARTEGGHVRVTVQDDGEGIPAEHIGHVTERFYRVDSSRNRAAGGTGLGLAICASLAAAMGGSIEIESASGQGTTASLILPTR